MEEGLLRLDGSLMLRRERAGKGEDRTKAIRRDRRFAFVESRRS